MLGPCGRIVRLRGDWRRGGVFADRDGAITLRLIDGRERGNDLTYRNGHVQIQRGGRVIVHVAGGTACG